MKSEQTKGFLALLYSAMAFGSFGVLVRLLAKDLQSYQQVFFRYLLAFVIIAGILLVRKIKIDFSQVKKKYVILFGLAFPLTVVFYTLSALQTKISITVLALYLGSILGSLIIGTVFFKEKITTLKAMSGLFACVGLGFFTFPFKMELINIGLFWGILSGILDAVSNGFRKELSGKVDRLVLSSIPMIGGLILSTVLLFVFNQPINFFNNLSISSWLVGILFALLLISINYSLNYGFNKFDLNLGTITLSVEVVFSLIFGIIFLTEFPNKMEIVGGLFVLLANVLPNIPGLLKKKN